MIALRANLHGQLRDNFDCPSTPGICRVACACRRTTTTSVASFRRDCSATRFRTTRASAASASTRQRTSWRSTPNRTWTASPGLPAGTGSRSRGPSPPSARPVSISPTVIDQEFVPDPRSSVGRPLPTSSPTIPNKASARRIRSRISSTRRTLARRPRSILVLRSAFGDVRRRSVER